MLYKNPRQERKGSEEWKMELMKGRIIEHVLSHIKKTSDTFSFSSYSFEKENDFSQKIYKEN